MEITFLSYFLASITTYLGLLVGLILIKMAPEEQKPGKRYFILLRKILFFILFIPMLYYYKINIAFSLALLAFVAALILRKNLKLDMLENSDCAHSSLQRGVSNRNFRHAQKHAPHFSAGSVFDKSYLTYFLLGIFFYLGSRFIDLFVVEAVLIFLYGIPNASLVFSQKKKNYNEIFINNLSFFVPVISLYFVF